MEPSDLWQRYIDPQYRDRAPFVVPQPESLGPIQTLIVNGRTASKVAGTNRRSRAVAEWSARLMRRWHADLIAKGWSPEAQLIGMDREGVDLAFLYPTSGLGVLAQDEVEPALALAISRAYND